MRRRFLMAISLWGLATATSMAVSALGKPAESRVGFQAIGPAGMRIEGTTADLDVTSDGDHIVIQVPLSNLKTGIEVRDRHMRDKYLEVQKYPQAKLTVARGDVKLPQAGEKASYDAQAVLDLHGQTKNVSVHYDLKGEASGVVVDGKLHVNMKDVGIEVPSYLGVTVKPDVDVNAHFRITPSS